MQLSQIVALLENPQVDAFLFNRSTGGIVALTRQDNGKSAIKAILHPESSLAKMEIKMAMQWLDGLYVSLDETTKHDQRIELHRKIRTKFDHNIDKVAEFALI